ncbi:RapZ C-terminal domain-containing protein [Streptomyces sp. NBC_00691]|uniref:RapZ C-terminal domain-containing protein n=1 Tax=Streptomyces sp. NBC_00691 TaxID=2903671 RepID=UPI002E37EB08|nr:RNase adapter RapZ [Streptomyces sp. NBC_00691]
MTDHTQQPVTITSFGYGHAPAPEATAVYDVRAHFRDPHVDPALRHQTAESPDVFATVMNTPGVAALVDCIVHTVFSYRAGPTPAPITIAIGCVGGRHRSAAIAIRVAQILAGAQMPATLEHRDIARPVIARPETSTGDTAPATAAGGR